MNRKIILAAFVSVMISCSNRQESKSDENIREVTTQTGDGQPVAPSSIAPAPDAQPQAQTASGTPVLHYICPNNDGGGGNVAGKCAKCGAELMHNAEFHKNDAPQVNTGETQEPQLQTQPQLKVQPPQITSGVLHYICPNNDGGGGDAVGKCPRCGAELAHNADFHKNDAPQVNSSETQQPQLQTQPQPPQPASNPKAGVTHYICPNNDGGGGDAAGKCAKCGADLVHNDKFH